MDYFQFPRNYPTGEPWKGPPSTYFYFKSQVQPPTSYHYSNAMVTTAIITEPAYPAPKSHPIVIVGAINSSYADRTFAHNDLEAGAVFAYICSTSEGLRVCPTMNLASEIEEVFLCHDAKPNLIYNSFTNVIEVGEEGISKGDVLLCRCLQNTWVQQENRIKDVVGTDRLCTAFDEKRLHGSVEDVKGESVCEEDHGGVEHFEDGGGVMIGEGLGAWKEIAKAMAEERKIEAAGVII